MTTIYKSEAGGREIRRRYEEALADWPVPAEHVRVPTREGETFAVVSGPEDAPPVVLLHGSGANALTWAEQAAAWAGEYRTYAVDLVGEPGLSAPSRPELGTPAPAAWLDDVLDGLGLSTAVVVGMSLGGWFALDYAIRRPARVRRLVLLCPGGVGRQKYGMLLATLPLRAFGRRGLRRSARLVTGLDTEQVRPVLDTLVLTFTHFRPRTEKLPVFGDDALRALPMPVLVIAGARDAMFDSAGTARRIRTNVPDATVTVLPDAGHALLGQTAAITAFLEGARA